MKSILFLFKPFCLPLSSPNTDCSLCDFNDVTNMEQIAGIALLLPWRILPRWSIFICPTRLSSIWSISTSRDQRNIASRLWSQSWRRTSRRRRSFTMSKMKYYFLESRRIVSSSLSLGGWEVVEEGLTRWGRRRRWIFFVSFFILSVLPYLQTLCSRILILSKYCLFVKKCCLDFYRAR